MDRAIPKCPYGGGYRTSDRGEVLFMIFPNCGAFTDGSRIKLGLHLLSLIYYDKMQSYSSQEKTCTIYASMH